MKEAPVHCCPAIPRLTGILLIAICTILAAQALPSRAATIPVPGSTGQQGLVLRSQSVQGVDLHFEMGSFDMSPIEVNGATVQHITMPGVFLPNNAGAPDLPGLGRYIAVPQGAVVRIEILSAQTERMPGIDVSPAPVIPKETERGPLVYNRDAAIYETDAPYPAAPAILSQPCKIRGVDAVILGITPFQYNPVSRELTVYKEMDVRVTFAGGNGRFGEDRLRSRFWEPILQEHMINYASLPQIDLERRAAGREGRIPGYDYIIICPDNPAFIPWADTLKTWRKLEGITAEVFTTTEVGGTTTTAIESFLNNAYNTWDPAPSAFMLLGDFPSSGFRDTGIISPIWNNYCASDNIYADVDGDNLPDMIHARITARNAAELQTMIGKMLEYERTPVTDPLYYDRPLLAGGWQDERWFILCTEVLYGHQANVLGKHPVREYAIYSGNPGSVWSTNPNTYMIVNYFGPGGLGYIPSTPQHLTDWGGNATRINNDLNSGAYLLMHRDHGMETGWGEPAYTNANLSGLHNDKLPFVFSMNCLTGKYNWSSECFTEAFHRMARGAVGLIAASETSYSFVNDTYIWGMWDTMWPDFMPDYGPYEPTTPYETNLRTAFGQVSGKYFLQASNWPYNPGDKLVTYHLFHHHGDAFMRLYSQVPRNTTVIHDEVCFIGTPTFRIQAELGSTIGLTVNGEIVGVAHGTGLPMDVPIVPPQAPGDLRITVTKANCFRYDRRVPIIPPSGPYLVMDHVTVLDTPGDCDQVLDAGEQPGLQVALENVGIEPTTGVTGTLTTEDPYVQVLDGEASYPDIPAGGMANAIEPYRLAIAGNVPDGHQAAFLVQAHANEGSWDCRFSLDIHAPALRTDGYVVNDEAPLGDADGVLDPGESFHLQLWVVNGGHGSTGSLTATLTSTDPNVVISDADGECPGLPPSARSVVGSFVVQLLPSCPTPSVVPVHVDITDPAGYAAALDYTLTVGSWFDDAETERGWAFSAAGDNASTGLWVRAEPVGTTYGSPAQQVQPDYDHTADPAQLCFVTGNGAVGGAAGESDVDGGRTTLVTPAFDLHNATSASISYWRWYTNNLGNNPSQDYWTVDATADGANWVHLENTTDSANSWNRYAFTLNGLIPFTDRVQIRFVAADEAPGSLVEAAVDDFTLDASFQPVTAVDAGLPAEVSGILACYPNPTAQKMAIRYQLAQRGPVRITLHDVTGRRVRTILSGGLEAGVHQVDLEGLVRGETPLASGIYFLRMQTRDHLSIRQVTVLR